MPSTIPSASRIAKGLDFNAITAKRVAWGDWEFTVVAPFTVEVANASYGFLKDEHTYRVTVDDDGVPESCNCPGFEHHFGPKGMADKHMVALATVAGPVVIEVARNYPNSTGEAEELVPDGGAIGSQGRGDSGHQQDFTEDECDDCADLPDDFPCANCYISGRKDFPTAQEGGR